MAGGTFLSRFGSQSPPPDPKPQPWCREEGAHPVQGDAARTAPMGATPKAGGWMSQQRLTRTSKLSR